MALRDEAEELALAIEIGFDSVGDAVSWADSYIAALDPPPYALIEVSLAGGANPYDVAGLLRAVPGVVDVPLARNRLIARIIQALDDKHAKAEDILSVLIAMRQHGLFTAAAEREWSDWQTDCDLADLGHGSWDDIAFDPRHVLELCRAEKTADAVRDLGSAAR